MLLKDRIQYDRKAGARRLARPTLLWQSRAERLANPVLLNDKPVEITFFTHRNTDFHNIWVKKTAFLLLDDIKGGSKATTGSIGTVGRDGFQGIGNCHNARFQ
jgi:hypothetical protein